MTSRDLIFSYYPYPVSARNKTHDTIVRPVSAIVRERRLAEAREAQGNGAGAGPSAAGPTRRSSEHGAKQRPSRRGESNGYTHEQQAVALEAAERRAVRGLRPAGVDMGKEAEELSEEERVMDDDRDNLNLFGHRFLLPFGRRQTQAETEALPQSPTPSQEQDERRQEDQMNGNGGGAGMGSSPPPLGVGDDGMDEDEMPERDLDASMEDLDRSVEDRDGDDSLDDD